MPRKDARTTLSHDPGFPALPSASVASRSTHHSLEEKTYRHLRSLVLARSMRPGERIDVDGVAVEMGTSRTPVVNALKRLSQEWIVELRPRHGTYVRRFNSHEMVWLFQLREVVEGLAARLALHAIVLTPLPEQRLNRKSVRTSSSTQPGGSVL